MTDIVISEFLDEAALSEVPDSLTVHYDPELVNDRHELKRRISDVPALIVRSYVQVDDDLLKAGGNLKVVGRLGVGMDNIDLTACALRGIEVVHAPGENAASVGEYAVTMALMLMRGAYQCSDDVVAGDWPRGRMMGHELAGHRYGVIGLGNTGRASARCAAGLGMEVVACDPYLPGTDPAWQLAQRVTLEELLSTSDIVCLHVPLTDETMHLIDEAALERMKANTVVINAARGGVVEEVALAGALRAGNIAGAALDVFEEEPLSRENAAKFDGIGNLILTPHIAGVTHQANRRVSFTTVRNVVAALSTPR